MQRKLSGQRASFAVATDRSIPDKRRLGVEETGETVTTLENLVGSSDEETRENLTAGFTIAHKLKPTRYEGRKCMSDWGYFVWYKTSGLTEFYVLEEREMRDTCFAKKGESGVAAIDNEGAVEGLVFASMEPTRVMTGISSRRIS